MSIDSNINLPDLFDPSAVAGIGASRSEREIGYEAMANAVAFDGRVFPVNPSESGAVFNEPFVTSVTDIDDVDLALLCVPAQAVPEVFAGCGETGLSAAVIYTSGFAEVGDEGEQLQEEITEIVDEHDIVLLGPNTSGFVVHATDLYASFASSVEKLRPRNVAMRAD